MAHAPFKLLLEIQHLRHLLRENREEYLRNRYVPLIQRFQESEKFDRREHETLLRVLPATTDDNDLVAEKGMYWLIASKTFNWLASFDADPTKKHLQWILELFIHGRLKVEDAYKLKDLLPAFESYKARMPVEQRDLNRYKSLADVAAVLRPYQEQEEVKSNRRIARDRDAEMHKEATVIYNDARYKIVVPQTEAAACYFGVNTQWCTAATDSENQFDHYNQTGDLYIILDKKHNRRWQIHFESQQLMDENDRAIDLNGWIKQNPELTAFFDQMDEQQKLIQIGDKWVLRYNRGLLVKDRLGLTGAVDAYFHFDTKTLEISNFDLMSAGMYSFFERHGREFAKLFNDLGLKGNRLGRGHRIDQLYWMHGQWGFLCDIGDPVAQVGKLKWKKSDEHAHHISLALYKDEKKEIDYSGWMDDQMLHVSFFKKEEIDDSVSPQAYTKMVLALVQGMPEAKYLSVTSYPNFSYMTEHGKQWLVKNKPTMCLPSYAYKYLGLTGDVMEAFKAQVYDMNLSSTEPEIVDVESSETDMILLCKYTSGNGGGWKALQAISFPSESAAIHSLWDAAMSDIDTYLDVVKDWRSIPSPIKLNKKSLEAFSKIILPKFPNETDLLMLVHKDERVARIVKLAGLYGRMTILKRKSIKFLDELFKTFDLYYGDRGAWIPGFDPLKQNYALIVPANSAFVAIDRSEPRGSNVNWNELFSRLRFSDKQRELPTASELSNSIDLKAACRYLKQLVDQL